MKTIKFLMAFVACACATFAHAASVTADEAAWAARAWVAQGDTLGARIGTTVEKTTAVTVTNDAAYYVVKMAGRGTVVTSSDTESEPIVAFLDTSADCAADTADSPLKALLARDAVVRANIRAAEEAAKGPKLATALGSSFLSAAAAQQNASPAARKWAALLNTVVPTGPKLATSYAPVSSVDNVRVSPLLTTKWSQTDAQDEACYNYYCAARGEPKLPCGCTATAMAQVMYYHRFPTAAISAKTCQIGWNGDSVQDSTKGGPYDWDNMVADPANDTYSDTKWEAIGKLCWDCGVSIGSTYETNNTSAFIYDVPAQLTGYFGYANAQRFFCQDATDEAYAGTGYVQSDLGLHTEANRQKVILSNLEAGLPVILSIFGYPQAEIGDQSKWGGHAIVADGYGYSTVSEEQVEYVHLNLGWAGTCDAWYNLPVIDAAISPTVGGMLYTFTVIGGAAYNISPTESGELVSGCLTNMEGVAAANVRIDLCAQSDPYTVIKSVTTDSNGYWHFFAEAGDYIARVGVQEISGGGCGAETAFTLSESQYALASSTCGNSWGNNLALEYAVARIGTTNYASLVYALQNAKEGETVELLAQAPLTEDFYLTNSITICAADANAYITRPTGAKLFVTNFYTQGVGDAVVTNHSDLTLTDVVIAANEDQPKSIIVDAGCKVVVSGGVSLDTVETSDAEGFVLAGELSVSPAVSVYCPVAKDVGDAFGTFTCSEAVAEASASKIKNAANSDYAGNVEDSKLTWTYAGGGGSVTDVRVSPLLTTKWGQAFAGGYPCYNYYCASKTWTTYGYGATNYPVGSAAVALAQVARYFECPWDATAVSSHSVYWESSTAEGHMETKATVGGAFLWDKMVDEPSAANYSAAAWEAIGHLCWDTAINLESKFSATNEYGTTAAFDMITKAMLNSETGKKGLMFESAVAYYGTNEAERLSYQDNSALRDNIIKANLDAGRPVILRLRGLKQGGDAGNPNHWGEYNIVVDGYGYTDSTEYYHINVGQAGANNAWVILPGTISLGMSGTADEDIYDFDQIIGAVYNIHTTKTPNNFAFASGRVIKPDSSGSANTTVRIYASNDTARASLIAQTNTNAKGCWCFELAPGDYVAKVVDATSCDVESAVFTVARSRTYEPGVSEDDPYETGTCGNVWGIKVNLIDPVARIGSMNYETLSNALEAVTAGQTIELLKDVTYETSITIPASITIKTPTGNDPFPATITLTDDAQIVVDDGIVFAMQDLIVSAEADHAVFVDAGGQLFVKDTVGFGVVETSDATGFRLGGAITVVSPGLGIYSATALAANDQFGVYTGLTRDEAAAEALKISNARTAALGAEPGTTDGTLIWSATAVDPKEALVADLTDPALPKYYRSFDLALEAVTGTAVLRLQKNVSSEVFTTNKVLAAGSTLTLTCTNETAVTVDPASFAGFTVGENCGLVISNITFQNFVGGKECSFIAVEGEGSSVTIESDTTFKDMVTQQDINKKTGLHGGLIVAGEKAHVTVMSGTVFSGCKVKAISGCGFGGAINMYCSEGTLDLKGGTFFGCTAAAYGGAIYVYGDEDVHVNVSGDVKIYNNYHGNYGNTDPVRDNIYIAYNGTDFAVVGPLTGGDGALGVSFVNYDLNKIDCEFVRVTNVADAQLASTAAAFYNDYNYYLDLQDENGLEATPNAAGDKFLWYCPPVDDGQCLPSVARFTIVHDGSNETLYYDTADDAFSHISGDATVTMFNVVANETNKYTTAIEIAHRVVFTSDPDAGKALVLRRAAQVPILVSAGGELIVSNLAISGSLSGGGEYPLIQVEDGKLELQDGADIRNASGNKSRGSGGITVYQGTFTMLPGSQIRNCGNKYDAGKDANNGIGGGLLVEGASTAYLMGGTINGCYTATAVTNAAGVFVGNESKAYLSGNLKIYGNGSPVHRDLVVADKGYLYLDGALTSDADVRIHYDVNADTNLAAYVSWTGWTLDELKASAARLRRGAVVTEYPTVTGVVASNKTDTVILWSDVVTAGNPVYLNADGEPYLLTSLAGGTISSLATSLPMTSCSFSFTTPASTQAAEPEETEDDTMSLSFGEGKAGCWYTLYSASALGADNWTVVAEKYLTADGPVSFEDEKGDGDSKFWKVEATKIVVKPTEE